MTRRVNLICALAIVLCAQPRPVFDVAAIHEVSHSKGKFRIQQPTLGLSGSRFTLTSSLRGLIGIAYSLSDQQISGPASLDANAFEIVARAAPESTDEQLRLMCQSLLAERFHLTFHHEQKVQPVYELVAGRAGPKLIASEIADGSVPPPGTTIKSKPGRIASSGASMVWLAEALSHQLGRPVMDKTDIPGVFRIALDWTPDAAMQQSAYLPKQQAKYKERDKDPPSIFTAIQEQLGLRLESQRAMFDALVVDHIERSPTVN